MADFPARWDCWGLMEMAIPWYIPRPMASIATRIITIHWSTAGNVSSQNAGTKFFHRWVNKSKYIYILCIYIYCPVSTECQPEWAKTISPSFTWQKRFATSPTPGQIETPQNLSVLCLIGMTNITPCNSCLTMFTKSPEFLIHVQLAIFDDWAATPDKWACKPTPRDFVASKYHSSTT